MAKILYQDSQIGYNCFKYVKSQGFPYLGYHFQTARDVRSESLTQTPKIGFAITYDSIIQHFVKVESINGNIITVTESNYIKGFVSERKIDINSGKFRGFIN